MDEERKRSGKLVLRAQEEERRRVARDLHDEVNQALTAILLRLEALAQDTPERAAEVAELKRLALQAMDELLSLARQLRPTALDDHGLVPAIEAQLKGFEERTGIDAKLRTERRPRRARRGAPDRDLPRGPGGPHQRRAPRRGRARGGRADGRRRRRRAARARRRLGLRPGAPSAAGLGLEGMAERARLVGGELDLRSSPGSGTELTLRLP